MKGEKTKSGPRGPRGGKKAKYESEGGKREKVKGQRGWVRQSEASKMRRHVGKRTKAWEGQEIEVDRDTFCLTLMSHTHKCPQIYLELMNIFTINVNNFRIYD